MLRSVAVFAIVGALHFVLSVLGLLFILPAAFETQGGAGFWAAPGKSLVAGMAGILLAPLALFPAGAGFGFGEIAAVSVIFGVAAVALYQLWRMLRVTDSRKGCNPAGARSGTRASRN